MKKSRRTFLKHIGMGSAGLAIGGMGFGAKSYANIVGANERVRVAVMGTNSRGLAHIAAFGKLENAELAFLCDADDKALAKGLDFAEKKNLKKPAVEKDIRRILANKEVDAISIAAPDHWHAPATILACQAGKHVYVEKPLSHNPHEGELAVQAARKYKRVVQMGSQRRSWPILTQGIQELHGGVIGKVHMAKAWYTNNRESIGTGKNIPVPEGLDYELWQGPAPRRPYRSNLIHYNWHWFWHWGTGEALNNGTHEIDVVRWGLGIDYPLRVNSAGGRYHFKDDWETPDTQIITYDCPGDTAVVWEGRSCNGRYVEGEDRGVIFYGEGGSLSTGGNSYTVYDKKNKLVKEIKSNIAVDGRNTASPSEGLDIVHFANFLDAIKNNTLPNADVETGYKSTLWVQLGNISHRVGHTLNIDQRNGHILDDSKAAQLWRRDYEKGWEPRV
ncbi:Gfo/Idh/MocA family protein [Sediminibacterium soli]|uniref:Gfo/Idh/MocA family protein n=1 Tax=Sediminibacterium soli TaxID=2698829 RepID=UPI00137B1D30|nr:Gfo/Idh/MocA family oxidoreductase [Sediminibacterium soli]NCI46431.1 Gfo/Idh/MocA family oxidoreductase [Sediminibacterium soli]